MTGYSKCESLSSRGRERADVATHRDKAYTSCALSEPHGAVTVPVQLCVVVIAWGCQSATYPAADEHRDASRDSSLDVSTAVSSGGSASLDASDGSRPTPANRNSTAVPNCDAARMASSDGPLPDATSDP